MMSSWLAPPSLGNIEANRKAALLLRLLQAIAFLAILAAVSSLFDSKNDVRISAAFYGAVLVWLLVAGVMVRRGRVIAAAWAMGGFFWVLIASVTVFFGGMQGQNASTFAVAVLLLGGIVGGRAAMFMAVLSSLWCGLIVYLELHGLLPPPLVPYSPINAWGALSSTVLLTSVLLKESLSSLSRMYNHAEQVAKERDEALRRSILGQKLELVGSLTSGIAHDFNNLLSVISSASSMLRGSAARSESESAAALDDLDEATNRAVLMTRQLLSVGSSKVETPNSTNLGDVVRAFSKMLPRLLGSKIIIKVEIKADAWVFVARVALEQIILNLAVNARDAMPDGGELTLSVQLEGEVVLLVARDTGVGMTDEARARIFEPFFSTKATGTGLGLSTVMQYVERAAGTIEVTSVVHQGTSFMISFPQGKVGSTAPRALDHFDTHQLNRRRSAGRIVLVEDDPLVRRATSRSLQSSGYEVVPVLDGHEALSFCSGSQGILCVVSDISMPRLDGEELARRLLELNPTLPMILLSGNREPGLDVLAHEQRRYLSKPCPAHLLLATIEELTGCSFIDRKPTPGPSS